MFDGQDRVDTGTFLCPACRGQLFELDDAGTRGVLQVIQMTCAACRAPLQRPVLPSMREDAVDSELPQPAAARATQLWCDARVPLSQASPRGVCWGLQFRVLERANELFSRCTRCGNGDSLGMLNPAVG